MQFDYYSHFEQEIIRIKKEHGSLYFSKPNFHAVLKDLSPNIDEKLLIVFRVADHQRLFDKVTELAYLEDELKSIRIAELKRHFTLESALDKKIASSVFWAYLYGNDLVSVRLKNYENFIQVETKEDEEDLGKRGSENYPLTKIGTQKWMAENLKVNRFQNGDLIFNAQSREDWIYASKNTIPAFCKVVNEQNTSSPATFLYNWYAVNDSRKIEPLGFRVPDKNDWKKLNDFIKAPSIISMKDLRDWEAFKYLDSFDFMGYRDFEGYYNEFGKIGIWWARSNFDVNYAFDVALFPDSKLFDFGDSLKSNGYAVKCILN